MNTKKSSIKKKKKSRVFDYVAVALICVISIAAAALIYNFKRTKAAKDEQMKDAAAKYSQELQKEDYPKNLVYGSSKATVAYAAQKGWIPCPGKCLKLATPGWTHRDIAGYSPDDMWFVFNHAGGWRAYSQRHAGHIIRKHADRAAEDMGPCPVCGGKGWIKKPKATTPSAATKKGKRSQKQKTVGKHH